MKHITLIFALTAFLLIGLALMSHTHVPTSNTEHVMGKFTWVDVASAEGK